MTCAYLSKLSTCLNLRPGLDLHLAAFRKGQSLSAAYYQASRVALARTTVKTRPTPNTAKTCLERQDHILSITLARAEGGALDLTSVGWQFYPVLDPFGTQKDRPCGDGITVEG